ncbi:MAG TPA: TonB family protein [Longimicrobiales bacterium]
MSEGVTRLQELEADYEIIGELGRGGSAIVYRARDRELGREVAIKVVNSNSTEDGEAMARLAREARLVALLRHPNIVPLLSVRHLSDGLALIMQHVPGRTLKRAIREDGPMPIEIVEHVLREIGSALAYAHGRHGIIHRDIKPENIYLDEEVGRAILSDFGIARSGEAESNLTLVGTALGTPAYMSPEQIDGTALDGRSDLYSLGLVAYEMLTGQQPWAGSNLYTIIYKQKHEELPPVTAVRNDIPPYLLRAVSSLVRKEREQRPHNAAQFLALLPASGGVPDLTPQRREEPAVLEAEPDSPTIQYDRKEVAAAAVVVPVVAAVAAAAVPVVVETAPEPVVAVVSEPVAPAIVAVETPAEPVKWDLEDVSAMVAAAEVEVAAEAAEPWTQNVWSRIHESSQRSRLVAALTAFLVLTGSATMLAMINRDSATPASNERTVAANTTTPVTQPILVKSSGTPAPKKPASSSQNTDAASKNTESELKTPELPTVTAPDLKLPNPSRGIDEADFSSAGISGAAPTLTAVDVTDAPSFTPRTVEPELKNRATVGRALLTNYPPILRERKVGGTVQLWVRIDETGKIVKAQIKESSGQDSFDRAALKVAEVMQFSPALNRDQKVSVWIQLPIVFRAQ